MIITLSIATMVMLWLFFSGIFNRKDGTTLAALSFGSYVILYIISSAVFLSVDKYTINNACILTLVISGCIFGLGLAFRFYPKVDISVRIGLFPWLYLWDLPSFSEKDSDISEWDRMKVFTRLKRLPI